MSHPDLAVQLAPSHPVGLALMNPVMVAAGTFGRDGYGASLPPGLDFQRLGGIVAKTTTPRSRQGNPPPRIVHGQGWTLNSIGLQNPGIEAVVREHAPIWARWQAPVILSIAGERLEEFGNLAAAVEGVPGIAALEVNVSCPNVEGGLEFGQSPQLTKDVTQLVRESTTLPVIVKLSPNVTDIVAIAQAASQGGAHALTLTNTLMGMALDPQARRASLGATTGGVSGPALKPVALTMVYRVYQAVDIPIIGVGGISTLQDVLEFLLAGARAVQVGTANFVDPWTPLELLSDLESYLSRQSIASVADLIGAGNIRSPAGCL